MNIILIVSDTLRRDHLGCYGNKDIHTPYLDQFAKRCIQFDNCYAASFPTMPMRADLFTGKLAFTYLGWAPLPPEEKTLAQILQQAGYTTTGVVDTPFFMRAGYNYDRGFKDFLWIRGQQTWGECSTSGQAIKQERQWREGQRAKNKDELGLPVFAQPQWGEGLRVKYERRYEEDYFAPKTMSAAEKSLEYYYKEKFFLYIDTWDPHEPWDAPCWYTELYYPGYDGREVKFQYWDWREQGLSEDDIKVAHACYCGEITMVDRWVGRLLDKIELLGLMENTIIVFTSDHGFYFGEHGYIGKSRTKEGQWHRSPLYQEITRVPLLVYIPGVGPRRTKAMVSLVDLMPTLLELAKAQVPEHLHGESFVPILKEKKENFHGFVVTSLPLCNPGDYIEIVDGVTRSIKEPQLSTITTAKWTLLCGTEDSPAELYDIENDPNQNQNIIHKNWQVAKDLHSKFIRLLKQVGTDERLITARRRLSKL